MTRESSDLVIPMCHDCGLRHLPGRCKQGKGSCLLDEAEARIVAYMRIRAEDWRDRDPDGAKGLRDMADELESGAHRA